MMDKIVGCEAAADELRGLLAEGLEAKLALANEATTRLLLIDRLLGILGWSRDQFNPEQPTGIGAYTDYRLSVDGKPRLIVEAKRIGLVEPLTIRLQKPTYKNEYLARSCGKEMQLLLQQCTNYCSTCGIPFAVATTGSVWIILMGFCSGIEWGSMRSLVYHSLTDVERRFDEFYSLLSEEAIRSYSLEQAFADMAVARPTIAILPRDSIGRRPKIIQVADRIALNKYFQHFFGEITPGAQLMEHCYVESSRLSEFSRELRSLLDYNAQLDAQERDIDDADEDVLESEVEAQFKAHAPRTIILVGNIGAGKSTFIHKFASDERKRQRRAPIVADLINRAATRVSDTRAEEAHISRYILDCIDQAQKGGIGPFDPHTLRGCFERELGHFAGQRSTLKAVHPEEYELEVEKFLQELSHDSYSHLIGYLQYVKKRGVKPWIAFDNVDRGSDSFQELVYNFSHKLSSDAGCVTLITLREDTFISASESGFLDVRTTDTIFRVKPPELNRIIAKRRKYAERILEQSPLPGIVGTHSQLFRAISLHIKTRVQGDSDSIRLLITAFSQNNVRAALAMLRDYYTSPHSTFHEFHARHKIEQVVDEPDPRTEFTHFVQSLMLGNGWMYMEQESSVINLFAADRHFRTSHFLALRILAYLSLDEHVSQHRHLPRYHKLVDDFIPLGYPRHQIASTVRRLLRFGLAVSPSIVTPQPMESHSSLHDPLPGDTKLRLSAQGHFYLHRLTSCDYYRMRVAEDTIWYDRAAADRYIQALREASEAQPSYGTEDALWATDAHDVFMRYLRQSLLHESSSTTGSPASSAWAKQLDDIIERNLFGAATQLSARIDISESMETDQPLIRVSEASAQRPLRTRNTVLPSITSPAQLSLFDMDEDSIRSILQAMESLGSLPVNLQIGRSAMVARVLWALEVAARAGLGPLRASDIAKLISHFGRMDVSGSNISRFFRGQRLGGEFSVYWEEHPYGLYAIRTEGRSLLTGTLTSSNATVADPVTYSAPETEQP